jgi:hypothetical protein
VDEPKERKNSKSSDEKAVDAIDINMDGEEEDDDEEIYRPKRKAKGRKIMADSSMDEEEKDGRIEGDDEEIPMAKKKKTDSGKKRPLETMKD